MREEKEDMELPNHAKQILLQLNQQRAKGFLCDVIIVVENALFRAHKNILAASSIYFKSLMLHDNLINLDTEMVNPSVFRQILDFIYTANERAVSTVHVSEWCSSEVPKQEVRCICPSAVFQDQAECEMASTRRLQRELEDIQKEGMKNFRNLQVEESNMLCWQGLLVPDKAPYDKGAFKIEILFPTEYPFKPPKILFRTKIYHPNIDEKGQVCLSVISAENWKPATKVLTVIANLITLVNDPHPDHPLRADLAEEYTKDRKKFFKNAEEFTRKHAERRPADC